MARRWSSVLSYVACNFWHMMSSSNLRQPCKNIETNIVTRSHSLFALQYPYEKYGADRPLSGGTQFPFGRNYAHPPD